MGRHGLERFGPWKGQVVGCCEHGDERVGSIKDGEFLDYPRNCYPLTKGLSCYVPNVPYSAMLATY